MTSKPRPHLLALCLLAFALRVGGLTFQSLWRDEVDAIRFSGWPLPDLLAGLTRVGHNGPLYFILLRPWRTATGDSEFALRYPAAVLGVLAVPLGYHLARRLGFSRRVGVILALFLTTSPYLVWYGQEAKMYTLLLVLVLSAGLVYLHALRRGGARRWIVFTGLVSLSYYTHILAPLTLPVYLVVAFLHRRSLSRRWRGWLVSMAALTLPYLPLAAWQVPRFWRGYPSGHPFYPLTEELGLLLQLYSRGLFRFGGLLPAVVWLFLLLSGLVLVDLPGRRGRVSRLVLATWLFLPPLLAYLISRRVPVFEDRYLIYIAPAFYLLAAAGVGALRTHSRRLAGLSLGLALTISLVGLHLQQTRPIKADFRAAARYVAAQVDAPPVVMVQIPYLRHTWAYYYRGPYTLLDGLWTNDNKDEASVDAEMRRLTAGVDELWLVVSEEQLWDSRGMVRRWLDSHADRLSEAHFTRVDVYRYRLRPGSVDRPAYPADGGEASSR